MYSNPLLLRLQCVHGREREMALWLRRRLHSPVHIHKKSFFSNEEKWVPPSLNPIFTKFPICSFPPFFSSRFYGYTQLAAAYVIEKSQSQRRINICFLSCFLPFLWQVVVCATDTDRFTVLLYTPKQKRGVCMGCVGCVGLHCYPAGL